MFANYFFVLASVENPDYFSLKVYHGGAFSTPPGRIYDGGKETYIDFCGDDLDMHFLDHVMKELRYFDRTSIKYYFKKPNVDLDSGLQLLLTDEAVNNIRYHVDEPDVVLEIYTEDASSPTEYGRSQVRHLKDGSSCSRKLTFD